MMLSERVLLGAVLLVLQAAFIVVFACLASYEHHDSDHADLRRYAYFQDVHIMIFIGFGFLMTFLKKYGYGAIGFNLLLSTIAIQWAMIVERSIQFGGAFQLTFTNMIEADFAAAAVLISFGAVLGRLHPFQLLVMTLCEIVVYAFNIHIGLKYFKALDAVCDFPLTSPDAPPNCSGKPKLAAPSLPGSSMFVHTFGAYFGLSVSRMLYFKDHTEHDNNGSVYHSDLFSMIGTVFLWIGWPSFNAGILEDEASQYRAIINTYLSLVACVVTTFSLSSLLNKHGKLNIVHIQNATLAGGVAVGACANFMLQPYGALLIGACSAIVSVLGFDYVSPFLEDKLRVMDTCGVHNLHGMPGLLSAAAAIISILVASPSVYGPHLYATFPNHKSINVTMSVGELVEMEGWSMGYQAAMELVALAVTLGMAIVGGSLTGLVLRFMKIGRVPVRADAYNDAPYWELAPSCTELQAEPPVPAKPQPQQQHFIEHENDAVEQIPLQNSATGSGYVNVN